MKRLTLLLLLIPTVALAQVKNPTAVEFIPSPDHAQVTRYEIGYFLQGATNPVQVVDLGSCTPVNDLCQHVINTRPLAFNTYTARVKAYAGTVASDWSDPSNPFDRTPLAPGGVTVR